MGSILRLNVCDINKLMEKENINNFPFPTVVNFFVSGNLEIIEMLFPTEYVFL